MTDHRQLGIDLFNETWRLMQSREDDELMLDWVSSADFDRLLVETVHATYPPHEHEQFLELFRGRIGLWVRERGRTPQTA